MDNMDIECHAEEFVDQCGVDTSEIHVATDDTEPKAIISTDEPNLHVNKKYDLFISHSSVDQIKVNQLCEALEEKFKLRCLNSDRDLIPGKSIERNLVDGIDQSEKTLLVLSQNYVESMWCMTEAQHAIDIAHKSRENRVIPVLIEPIEIPAIIRRYTYIDGAKEKDIPARIHAAFYNPGKMI